MLKGASWRLWKYLQFHCGITEVDTRSVSATTRHAPEGARSNPTTLPHRVRALEIRPLSMCVGPPRRADPAATARSDPGDAARYAAAPDHVATSRCAHGLRTAAPSAPRAHATPPASCKPV